MGLVQKPINPKAKEVVIKDLANAHGNVRGKKE